jgi:hypothetical protein
VVAGQVTDASDLLATLIEHSPGDLPFRSRDFH